jgi:hypothetical protein
MASFSCKSGEIRKLNLPEKCRRGLIPFSAQTSRKTWRERLNSARNSFGFFPKKSAPPLRPRISPEIDRDQGQIQSLRENRQQSLHSWFNSVLLQPFADAGYRTLVSIG